MLIKCTNVALAANGIQINTVKDMKEQILEIADKLRNGEVDSNEAQTLLLCLFGVSCMYWRFKNTDL